MNRTQFKGKSLQSPIEIDDDEMPKIPKKRKIQIIQENQSEQEKELEPQIKKKIKLVKKTQTAINCLKFDETTKLFDQLYELLNSDHLQQLNFSTMKNDEFKSQIEKYGNHLIEFNKKKNQLQKQLDEKSNEVMKNREKQIDNSRQIQSLNDTIIRKDHEIKILNEKNYAQQIEFKNKFKTFQDKLQQEKQEQLNKALKSQNDSRNDQLLQNEELKAQLKQKENELKQLNQTINFLKKDFQEQINCISGNLRDKDIKLKNLQIEKALDSERIKNLQETLLEKDKEQLIQQNSNNSKQKEQSNQIKILQEKLFEIEKNVEKKKKTLDIHTLNGTFVIAEKSQVVQSSSNDNLFVPLPIMPVPYLQPQIITTQQQQFIQQLTVSPNSSISKISNNKKQDDNKNNRINSTDQTNNNAIIKYTQFVDNEKQTEEKLKQALQERFFLNQIVSDNENDFKIVDSFEDYKVNDVFKVSYFEEKNQSSNKLQLCKSVSSPAQMQKSNVELKQNFYFMINLKKNEIWFYENGKIQQLQEAYNTRGEEVIELLKKQIIFS